jgi:hypothetical protein
MTVRLFFARAIAPVLAALFIPLASAVCPVPQPRIVCAEYANSEAVVVATLRTARRVASDRSDTDGHLYTFAVKTRLRGDIESTFRVWEEDSTGRAKFHWKAGTEYLLFLARDSVKPARAWVIDGCGNSGPISGSGPVLEAIKSARASTSDSAVYGMVSSGSWNDGLPDAVVIAVGNTRTFSAKTDQSGRFLLRLPAGKYTLGAIRDGWVFAPEPFSYEDPRGLSVAAGACAQIQFSGARETRQKPGNAYGSDAARRLARASEFPTSFYLPNCR